MAVLRTRLILQMVDNVSSPARGIRRAIEGLERQQASTTRAMRATAGQLAVVTAAGVGLAAAFAQPVRAAEEFQAAMSNVGTLLDPATESVEGMGREVLAISRRVPVAIGDLTSALYNVRSAGIDAGDAMSVLEHSARLSVTGLGTTEEAVGLVTASINSFGLVGEEQAQIYDQVFTAVKHGTTTIAQLSQGFGAVADTAARANISSAQYLSAISALTTTGRPASVAHTQMAAAITALNRLTEETPVFAELGVSSFSELVEQAGGPVKAFEQISEAVGHNDAALLELLGSSEALRAVQSLTGGQNEAYLRTLEDMLDGHDSLSEAYQRQAGTARALRQTLTNSVHSLGISIGNALLPSVISIIRWFQPFVDRVAELAQEFPEVTKAVAGASFGLIGLAAAALSAKLAFLGLKSIGLLAMINGLKGIGAAGRLASLGLLPFRAGLRGIRAAIAAARTAMIGFIATSSIAGTGAGFAAMGRSLLGLLNPLRLVRAAFVALRLALISTGIGAIIVGIAAAGTLIVKNWSGITAMFSAFGTAFMDAIEPVRPALQPVIDLVSELKNIWDTFTGSLVASDESWASFGRSAGTAVGEAVNWFIELPGRVLDAIGEIDFLSKVVSPISSILAWFQGLSGQILAGIGQIDFLSSFVNPVPAILEWFSGLPGRIISAIGSIDLGSIITIPPRLQWLIDRAFGGGGDAEPVQANARGGLITGPGSGTSDSILSRLSNGEFVVRAAAVRKFGVNNLEAINAMRLPGASTFSPGTLPVAQTLPAANQNAPRAANDAASTVHFHGGITIQGGSSATAEDIRREFSREAGALMRARFTDGAT